ncbi:MAG: bacteriophage holin [Coxiellaceae bacterium]|nr:bacteriophage holin [Coxiellaceae bacterium]
MSGNNQKLKPCSFGFALGLWWGIGILLVSWISWWCSGNWGSLFVNTFASVYVGYSASFWGGVIGFIWGFVDFFIFGALIAWIYNSCCGGCCKKEG